MSEETSAPPAPPADSPGPVRQVRLLDIPLTRVRRPADLVQMLISLAGILVVLVLSVYAYSTTTGVTQDVQSALAQTVRSILLVPVNVIEGVLTLILPIAVIVEQVVRRNFRAILDAMVASALALVVTSVAIWLLEEFATGEMVRSLSRIESGEWVITITPFAAGLAAFLTAIGTRDRRRFVAISWNLLWFVLVVSVITGDSTLVAAIVSVLLGRAVGLATRYVSGQRSRRAHGAELVEAIRRTGVDPLRVIRIGDQTHADDLRAEVTTVDTPIGYEPTGAHPADHAGVVGDTDVGRLLADLPESATVAAEREGANRMYAVMDTQGTRWDAVVLDSDRQVIGYLNALVSTIVRRGLERRTTVSLRQASERAALMYYAAEAAGVNSPVLKGIAETEESVLLLGQHVEGARQVSDLRDEAITDDVMINAWHQLRIAHTAGLAHRNISADTVLVRDTGPDAGQVWLNGWEEGEIAAGSLARRVDRTQLLTMFALHVGAERAIAAAARVLSIEQLAEVAPLLQPIALPPATRAAARADKEAMTALREHLVDFIPTISGAVEPIRLTRFSARTAVTLTIAVVAGWILLTRLNFEQIADVVADANPVWMVVAFGLGLLTYLGSAMGLVGFSPDRLGLWRTTLVQVAASVVTLVAPAGVGPAALNLRFMQKRGIQTPVAVATVALLQLSQFVTTVLLLVAIALLTGSSSALQQLPSGAVVIVVGVVFVLVGVVFVVPSLRRWVIAKSLPTLQQVWPRLVWVVGQPQRLAIALGGNLLMTVGYLAAFAAALAAFGESLPVTSMAIIYLTGTAVGSAIPTPGGIGTVELALTTGLRTAGIATAAAASVAVLFRVLTFWVRVPLGWLALRHLQRQNAV